MKQVVLREGRAEVVDVPAPLTPHRGVLVRVGWSVISTGTERANLQSTGESLLAKARRRPELAAQVLQSVLRDGVGTTLERVQTKLASDVATGYSCAGTIVEVGAAVADLRVGQTVACAGADSAWHAEFVAIPRNLACPVPSDLPTRDAASAAVGAIALQGVRQAALEIGHVVVVSGLGLVGLLVVQIARAGGAVVIAVDPVASRRDLALRLGANAAASPEDAQMAVNEITGGLGADRTIIAAATKSDQPVRDAMQLTRKRGIAVVVGDVGLALTRSPFYEKEIDLRISCSYGPGRYDPEYEREGRDYPAAYVRWTENRNMQSYLELLRSGAVQWAPLVQEELPIENASAAFDRLSGDSSPLAMMLRYDASAASPAKRAATLTVPRRARRSSRGEIRLGLIGAGTFTRAVHLPNLRSLAGRIRVVGVATRSGISARNAARQSGAEFYTSDYRELLARTDVDAVLIATRHDTHADLAITALAAGKSVFLEKPAAMTSEELDRLIGAARDADHAFMVGFNRRFSTAARFLAERIQAHAHAPIIVYRVNADPGPPGDWTVGEEGGGRAVGEACHMVDLITSLAHGQIETIQVLGARSGRPDSNFTAQFRFDDGTLATLVYTTLGHKQLPKERIEVFVGDEVVVVDDFRTAHSHRGGRFSGQKASVNKGLREEWEAFHAAIASGQRHPIPLDEIRMVTEATFAIRDQVFA